VPERRRADEIVHLVPLERPHRSMQMDSVAGALAVTLGRVKLRPSGHGHRPAQGHSASTESPLLARHVK
jgi:hypothetical protein